MFDAAETGQQGLDLSHKLANELLSGGEPAWQKEAFSLERGAITDAMAAQALKKNQMADAGTAILQTGGNYQKALTPQEMGAQIANELYGSRTSEAFSGIEQQIKGMSMLTGQGVQAGSFGLGLEESRMDALRMMPNYNQTYATILGIGNLGGAIYGGFNQPRPPGSPPGSSTGGSTGSFVPGF